MTHAHEEALPKKTRWQRFRDYWLVDKSFEVLSKKKVILRLLKEDEEKKLKEEEEKKSIVSGVLEGRESLEEEQSAEAESVVTISVSDKEKKEIVAAYCALLEPSEELLRDRAYARLNKKWTRYQGWKSGQQPQESLKVEIDTQALLSTENSQKAQASKLMKEEKKQKNELFFWCLSEERELAGDNKKVNYDKKVDVEALIERLRITGKNARAACKKAESMTQMNKEEALKEALQGGQLTAEKIEKIKIIKQRIDMHFRPEKLLNTKDDEENEKIRKNFPYLNDEGDPVEKEGDAAETNSVEYESISRVNSKGKRVRYFIGKLASLIFSFGCGLTTAGGLFIFTGTALLGWVSVVFVAGGFIYFSFFLKNTPQVAGRFFSWSAIKESLGKMFSHLKTTEEKVGKALLFGFLMIAAAATGFVAGVLMYVGMMGIISTFGLACPPALVACMAAITAFCIASDCSHEGNK